MSKLLISLFIVCLTVCVITADYGDNRRGIISGNGGKFSCTGFACPRGQRCSTFEPCRGAQPCPPGRARCIAIIPGINRPKPQRNQY